MLVGSGPELFQLLHPMAENRTRILVSMSFLLVRYALAASIFKTDCTYVQFLKTVHSFSLDCKCQFEQR